jgi:predicted RNA-binding Zn ribbon-like protein
MKAMAIWISAFGLCLSAGAQGGPGAPPRPPQQVQQSAATDASSLFGLVSEDTLLVRSDVQSELGLTSDQLGRMNTLSNEMTQMVRSTSQRTNGDTSALATLRKQYVAALKSVLTDDQRTRLHELVIQASGIRAVTDATVQRDIGVTDEQKFQISVVLDQATTAVNSIRRQMATGQIGQVQAYQSMRNVDSSLVSALSQLITDDQKAKLKKLGGKTFGSSSDSS